MRQPPQEPMTLHLQTKTKLLLQMGMKKYLQQMTPNHLMVVVGEGDLDLDSDTLLKNSLNTKLLYLTKSYTTNNIIIIINLVLL